MRADLGLDTLKYRRVFRKFKRYRRVKHMSDERVRFKLFSSNGCNKVKIKGAPKNVGWPMLILRRKN